MKKILSVFISVLLVLSFVYTARAEYSATSVTGTKGAELCVYNSVYNNWSLPITKNYLVMMDISGGTTGSTMGAYVTPTYYTHQPWVRGVADEDIASGTVGRICIRGPHLVKFSTDVGADSVCRGKLVASAAPAGQAQTLNTQGVASFGIYTTSTIIGTIIGTDSGVQGTDAENEFMFWVDLNPRDDLR